MWGWTATRTDARYASTHSGQFHTIYCMTFELHIRSKVMQYARNTLYIANRSSVTLDPPPFCTVFTISLSAATVAHHIHACFSHCVMKSQSAHTCT